MGGVGLKGTGCTFGTGLETVGVFPAAIGAGTCVGGAVVFHEAEACCLKEMGSVLLLINSRPNSSAIFRVFMS